MDYLTVEFIKPKKNFIMPTFQKIVVDGEEHEFKRKEIPKLLMKCFKSDKVFLLKTYEDATFLNFLYKAYLKSSLPKDRMLIEGQEEVIMTTKTSEITNIEPEESVEEVHNVDEIDWMPIEKEVKPKKRELTGIDALLAEADSVLQMCDVEGTTTCSLGIGNNNSIMSDEVKASQSEIEIIGIKDWESPEKDPKDRVRLIYINTNKGDIRFNKNTGVFSVNKDSMLNTPNMPAIEALVLKRLNLKSVEELKSWEDPAMRARRKRIASRNSYQKR